MVQVLYQLKVTRDYVWPTHPIVQQNPVQSSTQSVPRMPAQIFGARFSSSNTMSPAQPTSTILSEDMEISSPGGSNKFDSRLTVKGQPDDQVMQFGGQHPGGPGVPSIGMALTGFLSQQQLGLSNSEMTWLPILTGTPGALGATYSYPYIAVDGSYYS